MAKPQACSPFDGKATGMLTLRWQSHKHAHPSMAKPQACSSFDKLRMTDGIE
ncbi:MAG: hypothetical protein IPH11_08705 [Ignavibacteriales bacterium]|nr:hypothetical protein [Ignavibacteriales bacterium]